MDYDDIFEAYYNLYRAEATTPTSTDDEYTIGKRLANEAVRRWGNYDGMYWSQLFTTAQTNSTGGVVTTTSGTATYAAPTAMKESGGYIKLSRGGTVQRHIPIIQPNEAQFLNDMATYAYFTGNPGQGFTLHINPAPDTTGDLIDYVYYKKPTEYTTGTDISECPDPDFIVNRMLANRFRASRNPYYTSALKEAENRLAQMKMDNDSGNWSNPWKVADNSGTSWGSSEPSGWTW